MISIDMKSFLVVVVSGYTDKVAFTIVSFVPIQRMQLQRNISPT